MSILNKHRDKIPIGSVYIGRGSPWGNPFVIGKDGTRDQVCDEYPLYLWNQIRTGNITMQQLADLHNKDLVCFCAPCRCHGETIEKAALWAFKLLQKDIT